VTSQTLQRWARRHAATSKLVMAIVFALLTVALVLVSLSGV
jgi:hypothetical protein